jgi:hypothetical protein
MEQRKELVYFKGAEANEEIFYASRPKETKVKERRLH